MSFILTYNNKQICKLRHQKQIEEQQHKDKKEKRQRLKENIEQNKLYYNTYNIWMTTYSHNSADVDICL